MVAKEHTLSFLQINWRIYSSYVLLLDLGMLQRQEIVASGGVLENPVFKIWGTSWWPLLLGRKAPPSSIDSDRAISDCLHQKPTIFLYVHIQNFPESCTPNTPFVANFTIKWCRKNAVKIQALRSHCSYCLMFGRWKLFESFTTL